MLGGPVFSPSHIFQHAIPGPGHATLPDQFTPPSSITTSLSHIICIFSPMSLLVPESQNRCWFCNSNNVSYQPRCHLCYGVVTPTRYSVVRVKWTIHSFDTQPSRPSRTLVSSLLDCLNAMDGRNNIAVRVGLGLQQIRTRDQAVNSPPGASRVGTKPSVINPCRKAVMIVSNPVSGKRFTICDWKQRPNHHQGPPAKLHVHYWNDGALTQLLFWNVVNQILNLDACDPVSLPAATAPDLCFMILTTYRHGDSVLE